MKKIKEKVLNHFFIRNLFLRKITFSIMKNNKMRIFYSSLLLLFASFLISLSINLPVNIENYKNAVLKQNDPYKSVVYYQSNPYNSPNFSFLNRYKEKPSTAKVFHDDTNINDYVKTTFDTYDPLNKNDKENRHIIPSKTPEILLEQLSYLTFLSGQVWDKTFIDELNSLSDTPDIKPFVNLICNQSGAPKEVDKAGDCVTWMIKNNAPGYISKNFNDPNFALTFGAIPFSSEKEELFTKLNGLINNNQNLTNIWGIDLNNTRLGLKKYKDIINKNKSDKFTPVLINKTIAKNYNLKKNQLIDFSFSYKEVRINNKKLDLDYLSSELPLAGPSVTPEPNSPGNWNFDDNKNAMLTDHDASSFKYNEDNYFCLTSKNYKDKITIENIPYKKKLKIIGITNDYGYGRFYTERSLLNEFFAPDLVKTSKEKEKTYFKFFKNNFFNAKLSELKKPQDYNTYSVFQPYGDYSPLGLNGGSVTIPDKPWKLNFDQNGLGGIDSLFSNEMFNNSYNSLLIALSILFTVIICLAIGISLIIIAVTNSNILQDNKKNLFVMKALGYKDSEINNIISKMYTYILFIVFFISLIFVYFCTIYALNFIFSTKEIFVPGTFKIWEIPIGIALLFIIYYLNKIISFKIIKKLNLSSELKK